MARKRLPIPPSGYTILVIDDQDAMRTSVRLLLEHEGHTMRDTPLLVGVGGWPYSPRKAVS